MDDVVLNSELRQAAAWMLDELLHQRLVVALAPAPAPAHRHHRVRVAVEHNPEWYRQLCLSATRRRRRPRQRRQHDTDIRRPLVIAALRRLRDHGVARRPYDHLLLPYLSDYLAESAT